jgi:hypothetical protein
VCLKSNFAGVEGFRLYSETYYGSKHLVEEYIEEGRPDGPMAFGTKELAELTLSDNFTVSRSIDFVRSTPHMDRDQKAAFFQYAIRSFGSTALALSGGATFGQFGLLFHICHMSLNVRR